MCLQLLPLMWLGLLALTSLLLAALKWLLLFRIKAGTFQKYDWTSRTKAVNMAVQVLRIFPCCLSSKYPFCHSLERLHLSSQPRGGMRVLPQEAPMLVSAQRLHGQHPVRKHPSTLFGQLKSSRLCQPSKLCHSGHGSRPCGQEDIPAGRSVFMLGKAGGSPNVAVAGSAGWVNWADGDTARVLVARTPPAGQRRQDWPRHLL